MRNVCRIFIESYVRQKAEEALAAQGDLLMSGQPRSCSLSLGQEGELRL